MGYVDEQKILHLKYKVREFKKTLIDGTTTTEEYAEVTLDREEYVRRMDWDKSQPLITFRLSMEKFKEITHVTQKGATMTAIFFNTASSIGGLFLSVASAAALIVNLTSEGDFISHVTKDLFVVKQFNPCQASSSSNPAVAPEHSKAYE